MINAFTAVNDVYYLAKPPGLSFRLQKCQNISFSYWALHVPDNGSVAVIHELNAHLWKHNILSLMSVDQNFTLKITQLHTNFDSHNLFLSNYNKHYLDLIRNDQQ